MRSVNQLVATIDIAGHTAKVGEDSTADFFPWELSSDRAITVLKFFVQKCTLPQSKMTISGYSHYSPVADNGTEAGKALNRRVEIKITKVQQSAVGSAAS
jgi:chemotaxis protein MotB